MASDGLVPDAGAEEPLFYGCPYPTCDFVSDEYDEVVAHIGDAHTDEEEFLPPLEIGGVDEEMDEEGRGVYLNYLKQKKGHLNEGDEKEKQSYINSSLHNGVSKRVTKNVSKSIYKSEEKTKNEELVGGDGGNEKNQDDKELGKPNKRNLESPSLLTENVTPTTSDGKYSLYTIPVLTYLCKYVTIKYTNTLSKNLALEEEVLDSSEKLNKFLVDLDIIHSSTTTLKKVIKKRDVIKSSILLYLLRQRVVYLSFINDKLLPDLGLNLNTVRRYLDKLEKDGLIVKIPKEDEKEFEEIEEMRILLQKYTRVGNHIHKIEFYCLSGIGGVLVGGLEGELKPIVPDGVMEQINDVYKGVVPREKRLEAEKLRQRVANFKAEEKAEVEMKQVHRERADKRLLELCSPFKKEIMELKREVVMVKPSEEENFTSELHLFVAELRKREELMSPLGVRKMWQLWHKGN